MTCQCSHAAKPAPPDGVDPPAGCQLNGVPVNATTGLLAVAVLAGTMLVASVGYRLLADGAADLELPAGPAPDSVLGGEEQDLLESS